MTIIFTTYAMKTIYFHITSLQCSFYLEFGSNMSIQKSILVEWLVTPAQYWDYNLLKKQEAMYKKKITNKKRKKNIYISTVTVILIDCFILYCFNPVTKFICNVTSTILKISFSIAHTFIISQHFSSSTLSWIKFLNSLLCKMIIQIGVKQYTFIRAINYSINKSPLFLKISQNLPIICH